MMKGYKKIPAETVHRRMALYAKDYTKTEFRIDSAEMGRKVALGPISPSSTERIFSRIHDVSMI